MTAYNCFFAEEHGRIKASLEAKADKKERTDLEQAKAEGRELPRKRRKKISPRQELGFENLGKMIGSAWKALNDKEKEKYKEMARQDAARLKQEFDNSYKASVSSLLHQGPNSGHPQQDNHVRSDPPPLPPLAAHVETSAAAAAGSGYLYPNAAANPAATAAYSNMLSQYNPTLTAAASTGVPAGLGMGTGTGIGSHLLTPEQQMLQQNYIQSLYMYYPTTNVSTSGFSTPHHAGLSPYPTTTIAAGAGVPQQQLLGRPAQPQPQLQQQGMSAHEMELFHAERMRNLLIQNGAKVVGSTDEMTSTSKNNRNTTEE